MRRSRLSGALKATGGKGQQVGALFSEVRGDHPSRGAVHPGGGHRVEPVPQLRVQILEIAKLPPRKKSWRM